MKGQQYLTLYSVNMTYNLKKSIIQWESVCICLCLRPRHGSLSAQCVVLSIDLPLLMYVAICRILCCFYIEELIKIKLVLEQSSLGFDR